MCHAVLPLHVSTVLGQFHYVHLQGACAYSMGSFTEPPLDRNLTDEQESYRTVQRRLSICVLSQFALPAAPQRAAVLLLLDLSSWKPWATYVSLFSHHRIASEESGSEPKSGWFWRPCAASLLCFFISLVVGEDFSACACSLLKRYTNRLAWGGIEWGGLRWAGRKENAKGPFCSDRKWLCSLRTRVKSRSSVPSPW